MKPLSIAVIGSGIAGLSAAWLLSRSHSVTLFEASDYPGGHANTIDVSIGNYRHAVDTGFIVYNPPNYPNLCALFEHLAVPTRPSAMTFAFSSNDGEYEYSGTRLGGLFGQPQNLLKPSHWHMLFDLIRFFNTVEDRTRDVSDSLTLRRYLQTAGYSRVFVDNHLLPMAAAIWSASLDEIANYPVKSFTRFFANHGLLQASSRPQWRTVDGGSREYVERLIADADFHLALNRPVASVRRRADSVVVEDGAGVLHIFDHVVIATHADQALTMLSDPSHDETALLGRFNYSKNLAVVHTDESHMPRRRRLWSSWNYLWNAQARSVPTVSYWMNSLQKLTTETAIFVTLNPAKSIDPACEIARFAYDHPLFDPAALSAQKRLWSLQGQNRTWYCGSYFGAGFHEDGLQAGLAVAEQLGGVRRPWQVANESGRIFVEPAPTPLGIAAE